MQQHYIACAMGLFIGCRCVWMCVCECVCVIICTMQHTCMYYNTSIKVNVPSTEEYH